MSLRFRYKLIQSNHPIVTLGGRWVRPRPVFSVSLLGPAKSWAVDSLLDTGADDTVFPEAFARRIGLDLTNAPVGFGTGAAMAGVPLRYARVSLRVTDGREFREWPAWVGFTPVPMPYPMLGFAGFLQFFTAVSHGGREELELTINSLYPGT